MDVKRNTSAMIKRNCAHFVTMEIPLVMFDYRESVVRINCILFVL